jgi:hypothetical protein
MVAFRENVPIALGDSCLILQEFKEYDQDYTRDIYYKIDCSDFVSNLAYVLYSGSGDFKMYMPISLKALFARHFSFVKDDQDMIHMEKRVHDISVDEYLIDT